MSDRKYIAELDAASPPSAEGPSWFVKALNAKRELRLVQKRLKRAKRIIRQLTRMVIYR